MSHQADTDADTETFKYRGDRIDPLRNNKGTIEAKITDWYCSNEIRSTLGTASSSEGEEDPEAKRYKSFDREYVIRIFATTKRGTSIGINVFNYTPHFFVEVPEKIAQILYPDACALVTWPSGLKLQSAICCIWLHSRLT